MKLFSNGKTYIIYCTIFPFLAHCVTVSKNPSQFLLVNNFCKKYLYLIWIIILIFWQKSRSYKTLVHLFYGVVTTHESATGIYIVVFYTLAHFFSDQTIIHMFKLAPVELFNLLIFMAREACSSSDHSGVKYYTIYIYRWLTLESSERRRKETH